MLHEGHSLGEPQRLFEEIDIDMVRKHGTGYKAMPRRRGFRTRCQHNCSVPFTSTGGRVARQVRWQGVRCCAAHQSSASSRGPRTYVEGFRAQKWVNRRVACLPWLTQLSSTTACAATEADFKRLEKLVEEQRQLVRARVEGGRARVEGGRAGLGDSDCACAFSSVRALLTAIFFLLRGREHEADRQTKARDQDGDKGVAVLG